MRKGIVVIPTVLLLGGLLTVITLTGSLVVYLLSRNNYGLRLSSDALSASKTGLQDGILRLIRDSSWTPSGGYDPIGNGRSQVRINVVLNTSDVLQKEVIAIGCAQARYRQLRALVEINKNTGELKVLSTEETPALSLFTCS